MTALEAKKKFGEGPDGYVNCYRCPIHDNCPLTDSATGFDGCWEAIANAMTTGTNPYWERICKLSERQRAKGMETYGQGLESNPAAIAERFNHLEEELVDALMYCEWIKDKIAEMEGKNRD